MLQTTDYIACGRTLRVTYPVLSLAHNGSNKIVRKVRNVPPAVRAAIGARRDGRPTVPENDTLLVCKGNKKMLRVFTTAVPNLGMGQECYEDAATLLCTWTLVGDILCMGRHYVAHW